MVNKVFARSPFRDPLSHSINFMLNAKPKDRQRIDGTILLHCLTIDPPLLKNSQLCCQTVQSAAQHSLLFQLGLGRQKH